MQLTYLNFASAKNHPVSIWRKLFLTAAVLIVVGLGARWAIQKESVANLESRWSKTQPRVVPKPVRSAMQQRDLDAQAKAVGQAVQQLNIPITDLIRTLQIPKDIHVALLGLDLGSQGGATSAGASGTLKILGEAKTPDDMVTYVAFLGDQPFFKSVYLTKHELNAAVAEKPYRFQLEAQWRE